jgi:PAS domain-containing protein
MNPPDSSPPTQSYTVSGGRNNQQNLSGIPLGNGVNDQLRSLQMSPFATAAAVANQQSMSASAGSMLSNGNDTAMMDQPLMLSMDMASGNSMGALDPQLSSVGDQFAALATTSPLTAMPSEYGSLGGGSTLTEFTKRRNWSQRILEELQDFLHVLTPAGKVVYASPSSRTLTGFGVEELIGKFITDFIHEDDSALYVLLW